MGGSGVSLGGWAGPQLWLGEGILQQVQWTLAHHHIPQAAHKTCSIGLWQGLAHRQLLQAPYRTDSRRSHRCD